MTFQFQKAHFFHQDKTGYKPQIQLLHKRGSIASWLCHCSYLVGLIGQTDLNLGLVEASETHSWMRPMVPGAFTGHVFDPVEQTLNKRCSL